MESFKDITGQAWNVQFTPAIVSALQKELGLPSPASGKFWKKIARSRMTFGRVLYIICREQCVERNITDAQFGQLLRSPTVIDSIGVVLINASRSPLPKVMLDIIDRNK